MAMSACCRRRPLLEPQPVVYSAAHLKALGAVRRRFGRAMHELGKLKKRGREQEILNPEARWQWLTFRKVKGRRFKDDQTMLELLKRDREAEEI